MSGNAAVTTHDFCHRQCIACTILTRLIVFSQSASVISSCLRKISCFFPIKHCYVCIHRLMRCCSNISDGITAVHPLRVKNWVDDMKQWPSISSAHIVCYLIKSEACDLKEAEAYKSLDSYNYVQSGWVGQVLCHKVNEFVYLKADVRPSQAINQKPWIAWACVKSTGQVNTAGCSCMAGRARVCSHVGALLWKAEIAFSSGMTGSSCTDHAAEWNRGTKRNVEPVLLQDMNFKLQKTTVDPESKVPKPTRKFRFFATDEELQDHIKKSAFSDLFNIPGEHLFIFTVNCD